MNKFAIIFVMVSLSLLVSLSCNIYLYLENSSFKNQFNNFLETKEFNEKVIAFNKIFVDKVLVEESQVSYEDRIKLENAVIATQDTEIIDQWHSFLNAKSEAEAQQETKKLLFLFANKLEY